MRLTYLVVLGLPLILLLGAVPVAAADPDRNPVLLRKTMLLPPYESAGTGLAPEVKVRVKLDRRGGVADIEILGISPPSDLDDVFRRRTLQELRTWRWAPAIEHGKPVATTLEWTVKFQANEGSMQDPSAPLPVPAELDLQEKLDRRRYLHSLPTEKKKEILEGYARITEAHLVTEKRRHYASPRFVVVSDSDSEELVRIVAHNLEAAFESVRLMHQPEIEPLPHELKTLVYLYRTRAAFETMRAELLPLAQQRATYLAPGLIIYHLELASSEHLLSFLVHEASHAYSDHHLRRPSVAFPIWFEEGFAEYMGNSRIKDGKLQPGSTQKREYAFEMNHFSSGVRLRKTVAGWDLETVKKSARRGEGMSLRQVMDAAYSEFYGEDFPIHYGTAWLAVHFLRHGRPEWEDGRFSKLAFYLAEGYSDDAAIQEVYGTTVAELETPFLDYIKDF